MLGEQGTGKESPIDRVDKGITSFRKRSIKRLTRPEYETDGPYAKASGKAIDEDYLLTDLGRLGQMNSQGLDHIVGTFEKECIFFGDITVRNFFAAFWAARWANDEDRQLMMNWFPDPHQGKDHKQECREFWEMVIGLRKIEETDEANHAYVRDRWEALFSPLFDSSFTDESGFVIRSTELMYTIWEFMEGTKARNRKRSVVARLF